MAQYKVPQDVEADDKLLGPFSFRQFVYLMIAGALIALAVGLFQLFPLLAIIPLPPVLLFVALALPLKKDQPMETYLAALVSYYLKPRTRVWTPGQRESTIKITAPKKVEPSRTRDITGEEATHRLSFLADIVDTEGYAIKGINTNPMREDLMAEASTAVDMFEGSRFNNLASAIQKEEVERHDELVKHMKETIEQAESLTAIPPEPDEVEKTETKAESEAATTTEAEKPAQAQKVSSVVVMPDVEPTEEKTAQQKGAQTGAKVTTKVEEKVAQPVEKKAEAEKLEKAQTNPPKPSIIELANNDALSVATIAKEAKRLKRKEEGEVFISLH